MRLTQTRAVRSIVRDFFVAYGKLYVFTSPSLDEDEEGMSKAFYQILLKPMRFYEK